MHRKFIALITAAAIAVTGVSAAPARADDNTARFLAGLTALAIIGMAVKSNQDRNRENQRVTQYRNRPNVPAYERKRHNDVSRDRRGNDFPLHPGFRPVPLPRDLQRYTLPRSCVRNLKSYGDRKLVFGERCLQRNYDYMRQLPRGCRVDVRTNRGRRQGYSLECLENQGYRMSRN